MKCTCSALNGSHLATKNQGCGSPASSQQPPPTLLLRRESIPVLILFMGLHLFHAASPPCILMELQIVLSEDLSKTPPFILSRAVISDRGFFEFPFYQIQCKLLSTQNCVCIAGIGQSQSHPHRTEILLGLWPPLWSLSMENPPAGGVTE